MKNKIVVWILSVSAVLSVLFLSFSFAKQVLTANISLGIESWPLVIWTEWQTLSISWTVWWYAVWQFDTGSFRVLDLNWSSEYWTTISSTDLFLLSGTTPNTISAENIFLKKWSGPITLSGLDNTGVVINDALNEYQPINLPVRYFSNDTKNWILWKYWDNPEIMIYIPFDAYDGCDILSFSCKYIWTINYTLYEL